MLGRLKAYEAEVERDVLLAWNVENFARAGKQLRSPDYYLAKMRPRPPQTAEQVIAIFETFAAQGLATIREVKNGE